MLVNLEPWCYFVGLMRYHFALTLILHHSANEQNMTKEIVLINSMRGLDPRSVTISSVGKALVHGWMAGQTKT